MSGNAANRLLFWAMAYKMSELLFAADEAGLLAGLAQGETLAELAARTGWETEPLATVLDVLARCGVVEMMTEGVRLAPGVAKALPLVAAERRLAYWHRQADTLSAALLGHGGGDPLDEAHPIDFLGAFVEAMGRQARETALAVRRLARPAEDALIVDLGGADGAVAAELADSLPKAHIVVVDRTTLGPTFAARMADRPASSGRITFAAHDLRAPDALARVLHRSHLVLVLNVLHLLTSAESDALLAAIHRSVRPGTKLVLREITPDGGGDVAPLFLIDWLRCGSCFRDDAAALASRLRRAGFSIVRELAFAGAPDRFLLAVAL